jgi:hypothetical protein
MLTVRPIRATIAACALFTIAAGAATELGAQSPRAPINVQARVNGQILGVRWTPTAIPDLRFTLVFRNPDTAQIVAVVQADRLAEAIDLDIPPGTQGTFTVSVVAVDIGSSGLQIGRASEEILFTVDPPQTCTAPPPPPTGLQGTRVLRTANIRWNHSALATSYIVRAGTSSGSSDLFLGNVGNVTTAGSDNVDANIPLLVSIAAANQCGVSAFSEELALNPSGGTPPACVADAQTMCLFNGRFTVRLSQRDPSGLLTPALVARRFNDGGGFGFLNTSQENLFIRVENRCSTTGTYLVTFNTSSAGIPASTAFDLFVGDNQGGISRTYAHAAGAQFLSFADGTSFNRCP